MTEWNHFLGDKEIVLKWQKKAAEQNKYSIWKRIWNLVIFKWTFSKGVSIKYLYYLIKNLKSDWIYNNIG